MNNLTAPIALVLLLLCPAMALAQVTVNFQANATVSGPKIVLADIAVIKPAGEETKAIGQLPVSSSPPPGQMKELYTPSVISSLRNRKEVADVDWQGSPTIVVKRKGTQVGQEQLQQIILGYLKENSARLPKTEIRFTLQRAPDDLTLPPGKLTWKVTPGRPGIIGSTSFSIAFAVDGKPAGNCIVRGKLEAVAEVMVAAVNLYKGDVINERSLNVQRVDIGGLDRPFFSREMLLGMQMARTVQAGSPIEQMHIVSPPVIKGGDLVKIHARKGSLDLSASGQARGDGRVGETIAVKNISSGKVIQCRVVGPGEVTVEF